MDETMELRIRLGRAVDKLLNFENIRKVRVGEDNQIIFIECFMAPDENLRQRVNDVLEAHGLLSEMAVRFSDLSFRRGDGKEIIFDPPL